MKKFTTLLIILLLMFSAIPSVAFAAEPFLIKNTQLKPSPTTAPDRLLLSFDLSESIDLSQENTNIIIEYLDENFETTNYIKDKLWSGYLNSYENYPSGEQKYSSGYTNENYPDLVPAAKIYTVTKTGAKIDIAKVSAVKITVLRADGSGEEVTVGIDGSILELEKIEALNGNEAENPPYETGPPATEQNLGIKIDSETAILPLNTILVAEELSSGTVYNAVRLIMADAINYIAIDIKLESSGQTVQPDGKVKISIPIPESFNSANLAVYRIDDDGRRTPYAVTITRNEATEYATFLTEHFSTYVLAEERKAPTQNGSTQIKPDRRGTNGDLTQNKIAQNDTQQNKAFEKIEKAKNETQENKPLEKIDTDKNKIPSTGRTSTQNYIITIISIIGLLVFINIKKIKGANQKLSQD